MWKSFKLNSLKEVEQMLKTFDIKKLQDLIKMTKLENDLNPNISKEEIINMLLEMQE